MEIARGALRWPTYIPGKGDAATWILLAMVGLLLWTAVPVTLAIILLLAAIALAAVSPCGALLAAISASPFVFQMVPIGDRAFSLLELGILVAAIGAAARLLGDLYRGRRDRLVFLALCSPWNVTIAALLLLFAGIVSLFTVADPAHRHESIRLFRWVIVEPLLVLAMVRLLALDGKERTLLVGLLLPAALVACVAGIDRALNNGVVSSTGVHRATWPFPHPNNLALYLERAAIAGFALTWLAHGQLRRVTGVLTSMAMLGVVLTLSRGGLLAMLTGVGVTIVLADRMTRKIVAVLAGITVAAATMLLAIDRLADTGSSGVVSSRELVWRGSLRMLQDHVVTGVGLDQFLYQYGRRYVAPAGWAERYTSHPHNIVLDFWLSLGLFGLLLLVFLVVLLVRRGIVVRRSTARDAAQIAALASLAAGFAHGLIDNGYFRPELAALTWLLIGIATAENQPAGMLAGRGAPPDNAVLALPALN